MRSESRPTVCTGSRSTAEGRFSPSADRAGGQARAGTTSAWSPTPLGWAIGPLGSVYPFDAQMPFPKVSGWYMRQIVGPGSIMILHDGPERGPRTAKVLRSLLPELRARGFRVVTVSALTQLESDRGAAER